MGELEAADFVAIAPVKLPRTWPNSSDSSSVSAMPAQFSATNGFEARGEWA